MTRVLFAVMSLAMGLSAAAQDVRFEVLSMKPVQSGSSSLNFNVGPGPSGFESWLSLWQAVMIAYGPANSVNWGSVEVLNAPKWIGDFYEIRGRVPQTDLQAWQHQSKEHELLRSAMRAALKERCRLSLHEQAAKAEVFELAVGKRGVRLKPADAAVPAGQKLASGGVMVQTVVDGAQVKTFHGATMQDLTDFLCIMSGRTPVRDRTGLSGRYDFSIRQVAPMPDDNHVYSYPVDHLGLQVKRGAENRPMLVIDHIEKPSQN